MNILLSIHHHLTKNEGAAGVTYQLYHEYSKLGHQVTIYSIDDVPSYVPNKLKSVLFPIFFYLYVIKLIKKQHIHVIDASSGDAWILGLLKVHKGKENIILVARSHGLEHTVHQALLDQHRSGSMKLSWKYPIYHGGLRLWEVSTSFKKSDGCLFLNDYDLHYAIEKIKTNQRFSRTISNGLPDYFVGLDVPIYSMANTEKIHIAQVGSYIPRKGIAYTGVAMNKELRKHSHIELYFIGTGCSEEKVLQDYDSDLHHRIHVISKYNHEELPELLIGKHILLFPSLAEGFPLVLIEAMACGLLPIATYTPGPMKILTHNENAVMVPPGDSLSIEQALDALISEPKKLYKLRQQAYRDAQQYKWSEIAKETIQFYDQLRLG